MPEQVAHGGFVVCLLQTTRSERKGSTMLQSRLMRAILGGVVVIAAGCAHTVSPAELASVQQAADNAAASAERAQRTADEALKKADQAQASADRIAPTSNQALQAANEAKETAKNAEALAKAEEEKSKRMMTKAMQK